MQLQEDIYTSGGVQTHTLSASLRTLIHYTGKPKTEKSRHNKNK